MASGHKFTQTYKNGKLEMHLVPMTTTHKPWRYCFLLHFSVYVTALGTLLGHQLSKRFPFIAFDAEVTVGISSTHECFQTERRHLEFL